jgi:hypothetical protein
MKLTYAFFFSFSFLMGTCEMLSQGFLKSDCFAYFLPLIAALPSACALHHENTPA